MNRTDNESYVFGSIMLLANKLQVWGDGIIEGLTMKQLFLLLFISKMEKPNPTVTEVAEFTGTSRQNTKKMLEQLEAKGFVHINKSKTDGRALNVSLSKAAYKYFAENDTKSQEAVSSLFSKITDNELNITSQTFNKLFVALETKITLEEK